MREQKKNQKLESAFSITVLPTHVIIQTKQGEVKLGYNEHVQKLIKCINTNTLPTHLCDIFGKNAILIDVIVGNNRKAVALKAPPGIFHENEPLSLDKSFEEMKMEDYNARKLNRIELKRKKSVDCGIASHIMDIRKTKNNLAKEEFTGKNSKCYRVLVAERRGFFMSLVSFVTEGFVVFCRFGNKINTHENGSMHKERYKSALMVDKMYEQTKKHIEYEGYTIIQDSINKTLCSDTQKKSDDVSTRIHESMKINENDLTQKHKKIKTKSSPVIEQNLNVRSNLVPKQTLSSDKINSESMNNKFKIIQKEGISSSNGNSERQRKTPESSNSFKNPRLSKGVRSISSDKINGKTSASTSSKTPSHGSVSSVKSKNLSVKNNNPITLHDSRLNKSNDLNQHRNDQNIISNQENPYNFMKQQGYLHRESIKPQNYEDVIYSKGFDSTHINANTPQNKSHLIKDNLGVVFPSHQYSHYENPQHRNGQNLSNFQNFNFPYKNDPQQNIITSPGYNPQYNNLNNHLINQNFQMNYYRNHPYNINTQVINDQNNMNLETNQTAQDQHSQGYPVNTKYPGEVRNQGYYYKGNNNVNNIPVNVTSNLIDKNTPPNPYNPGYYQGPQLNPNISYESKTNKPYQKAISPYQHSILSPGLEQKEINSYIPYNGNNQFPEQSKITKNDFNPPNMPNEPVKILKNDVNKMKMSGEKKINDDKKVEDNQNNWGDDNEFNDFYDF